ncbi:MAG: DUF6029 family protein [Candidatus Zixiibacteriota bacterium]
MLKKIIVLVLAVASAASAYNFNDWLSLNGTNSAVYMRQKEDGQRWTWDILQTELWAWRFAAGAEVEFNHPRRPVVEPVDRVYPEGDELIQRYGRYRDDIFDVRVGDFDKTLGKGLVLRSYADRDFEVYHRLDGGVADVHVSFADRDWGDVTALWGKNNRDEEFFEEGDTIAGGQITFRPFDFVYVSGAGVQADIEYVSYPSNETVEEKLYSGGLGGGWRYFDVYAEYATRKGYDLNLQEDVNGSGIYGVATGYLPRSSVSVEYKKYDDLSYGYSNPPPCSVRESAIVGPDSLGGGEWGYYVQATGNPTDDVRLRGGYSYADNVVGDVEEKTEMIKEYFGEVRYDLPWPVVLEAGYEYAEDPHFEFGIEDPTDGEVRRIPSLGVSTTPWDDHSFAAEFERENLTEYALNASEDYTYNRGSLGYTYSSWLGLTVSYEDSDKTEQELIAWGEPPKLPDLYREKNKWFWGEVRLSWYNPTFQNHTLTVGYGSQRGGLICSSGVCQQQAPFTGLKVALEGSF